MMYSALVQDDVFEDSIVDFFETADANKDGVLEYNDFYTVSWPLRVLVQLHLFHMYSVLNVCSQWWSQRYT